MSSLVVVGAQFRRTFIEFRRYVFETVSGIVTLLGFFVMLFLGARAVGGQIDGFGDTLSSMVVAYAVWAFALTAYQNLTNGVVMEAQQGTLEQLAMSPFGLVRVLFGHVAAGLVFNFGVTTVLLVLMMSVSGRWLNIDLLSVIPLALVTIVGIVGVGFAVAGLAVVFKRVESALQIALVVLIALVAVPVESVTFVKYFPLAWGTALLRRVMVDGDSILSMAPGDLLFLVANSAGWLILGVGIFKILEGVARDRDLLGHY